MITQVGQKSKRFPHARFDIVAIAASAGGLAALTLVLSHLPTDFPSAIVVVQHLAPRHRSVIAEILARKTVLHVKIAEEGDILCPGSVYIAPPDHHLLVTRAGKIQLSHTPQVQFVRPSADVLFTSVAACYQDRALAVVLSGTGRDGVEGIQAIKKMGGTVIAQNEETAQFFGMPGAAIASGNVDQVLPLQDIPATLETLVRRGNKV